LVTFTSPIFQVLNFSGTGSSLGLLGIQALRPPVRQPARANVDKSAVFVAAKPPVSYVRRANPIAGVWKRPWNA
jgi:hypothetical protein